MSLLKQSAANAEWQVSVVVALPAHRALAERLTYTHTHPLPAGTLVRVPLGTRDVLGVVWSPSPTAPGSVAQTEKPAEAEADAPATATSTGTTADPKPSAVTTAGVPALRAVSAVLDGCPPLDADWMALVAFVAGYYQRSLGEVALAALPPALRDLTPAQWARRRRKAVTAGESTSPNKAVGQGEALGPAPPLTPQQQQALAALHAATQPVLLFGATGSGKTEVYLQAVAQTLQSADDAQAIVMVPEINLTPQLLQRFQDRFGPDRVVSLHSGTTPAQRLNAWWAAHTGQARIVLGTRLAVLCSVPGLRLIVVDEEHDPSYKSQDGARYSARDLAVYRASRLTASGRVCRVLLGSATPSLESWHATQRGRYLRVDMPARIGKARLPRLRLVDMAAQPRGAVLAPPLVAAMTERALRGEQSLLLLNRRGYAPVLTCHACGWTSECPSCSAFRVFHKIDRTLRCHHCGHTERVPRACPTCGNLDIAPVGKGTEQLEEQVSALLSDQRRPGGQPLRVLRMDADSTRTKGSLEAQLDAMHSGTVDVLVGTQMVAKGHDFRRISLVAAVGADGALFAADYRASERLFSLLMQAGGRAGRDGEWAHEPELWVQTWNPTHPLFAALRRHDYPMFAQHVLDERQSAAMPPFSFQALLRAEARTQTAAQAFLMAAADAARPLAQATGVTLYPPVPMAIQRVARVERAQMLLESSSRPALQHLLAQWRDTLGHCQRLPASKGLLRWALDVDPIAV